MTPLERLQRRIPEETDEAVLEEMLDSAKDILLGRRFPYGNWPEEVEPQYRGLLIDMAEDLYNRIGAAGQTGHSENGINRSWGSEWISEQLLQQIVPFVGVL